MLRVLFFGSDAFSVPAYRRLTQLQRVARLGAVFPSDKRQGRGRKTVIEGPLKRACNQSASSPQGAHQTVVDVRTEWLAEVPPRADFFLRGWTLIPSSDADDDSRWDLGVVVSFGHFLPRRIIEQFRLGMINVHPSLLPQYRGAAPIQHAIWNGDRETGVSVIDVHPQRMDAGGVLHQVRVPVPGDATYATLSAGLAEHAADCIEQVVGNIEEFRANQKPQYPGQDDDEKRPMDAPKIPATAALVGNWADADASEVDRRWRAFDGFMKTPLFTHLGQLRLNFTQRPESATVRASLGVAGEDELEPGQMILEQPDRVLWVKTGSGAFVGVSELQPAGKKPVNALDFARGRLFEGDDRKALKKLKSERFVMVPRHKRLGD